MHKVKKTAACWRSVSRVHAPAVLGQQPVYSHFAGCVSMVGSENDDAIVILAVCLQVGKEPAHAVVDLARFPGDSAVEAMVYSRRQRQIVLRKHMHVHGLSIKEHRLGLIRTIV